MQKITPFLWFDGKASEAMEFYTSVFQNAKKGNVSPMMASFQLEGQDFIALNGGPMFKPTPSISFFVSCDTAQEIDSMWAKLSEGGMAFMPLGKYPFSEKFGWLQDKFGVSWQLMLRQSDQKITPFLTFIGDNCGRAEEAMKFYVSVFRNSVIESIIHFTKGEQGVEGTVKHGVFCLDGQNFMALDSNMPHGFTFTEGISLFINCETQEEVDYYWDRLAEGGAIQQCGWLKDKFGVSWQVVPNAFGRLMRDPDPVKSKRVFDAMMKMKKIVIQDLQNAYDGN